MEVVTNAMFLPPNLWFKNTIVVTLHEEIKEFVEDQNGIITYLGSYHAQQVSPIKFKPICFSPHYISQILHQFILDTKLCRGLGKKIAFDSTSLRLRGTFVMYVNVKLTREVRFMILSVVTVPSKAASEDVLQRLVEEQRVESIDLEEETTCSICMEDFSELSLESHEKIIRMPDCFHLFHQSCIFEWLKRQNSCPLCRRVPYENDHETECRTET